MTLYEIIANKAHLREPNVRAIGRRVLIGKSPRRLSEAFGVSYQRIGSIKRQLQMVLDMVLDQDIKELSKKGKDW